MAQEAPKGKPAAAPAAAAEAPAASGAGGWMPVIAVIVAVPLLSIATAQFVIYPAIDKRISAAIGGGAAPASGAHAPATGASHGSASGHGKTGEAGPTQSYEFKNIVSNLAGAMKSRYIKVTFTVYGSDPKFNELIESNKAKLLDTTLGVLGSLTLAEMEDAGVKNKIRTSLAQAYQTVLRARVVEEVYFSEFVIQ